MSTFDPQGGRQTEKNTWEWPCGCLAHRHAGEVTIRACREPNHEEDLQRLTLGIVTDLNPNVQINSRYV